MKMSNLSYKMMVNIGMPIRNLFTPPAKMISEIDITRGQKVLDYGCGPGIFSIMIAEITGPSGIVYALDIHPLAIQFVEKKAQKRKLKNIKTILSDCSTALPDNSMDCVLFFDVFHSLNNQEKIIMELHRVMKSNAALYFSDHHMKEPDILKQLTEQGLFKLQRKAKLTFTFGKMK